MKAGSSVGIPLIITQKPRAVREITVKVTVPGGWKVISGAGKFVLPDEERIYFRVELQSPEIPEKELKRRPADSIVVSGISGDSGFGEAGLRVLLRLSALPQ